MGTLKPNHYVVIQWFMIHELGLKGNELMIYAVIYGYSQDKETQYRGGISYLMEWTSSTKQSVIKCLNSLKAKGLIVGEEKQVGMKRYVNYRAVEPRYIADIEQGKQSLPSNNDEVNKVYLDGEKSLPSEVNKVYLDGEKSLPINNINNTIHNKLLNNNTPITPTGGRKTIKDTNLDILTTLLHDYDFSQQIEAKLVEWYSYKAEQKKKITPIGMKSQLTKVDNMINSIGENSVIYVLDESMANNYQGMIWDLANKGKKKTSKSLFDEWGVE